jgi:uncharacterized membrane protein
VAAAGLAVAERRDAGDMNTSRLLRHWMSPAWIVRRRFPPAALKRIQRAIAESESQHGGQIRFAVEHALETMALFRGMSAAQRALQVFSELRVWDTELNNGVLIYLLLADRDVEIIADRGIHARVGKQSWEAVCREMEGAFRQGRFEEGVLTGIKRVSALLKSQFPDARPGNNELSDRPVTL